MTANAARPIAPATIAARDGGRRPRGARPPPPPSPPGTAAARTSADVDPRPFERIPDRLAQHLARDGGGVALAEGEVAQGMADRASFRPSEIGVGDEAGQV